MNRSACQPRARAAATLAASSSMNSVCAGSSPKRCAASSNEALEQPRRQLPGSGFVGRQFGHRRLQQFGRLPAEQHSAEVENTTARDG
ncbi:MAG: hypothetical protein QM750_18055 [Rubrivivax sp.]